MCKGNVILKTIGTIYRSFAIDGALFRTQDMPELRAHFGSGNTFKSNRQTPYPMLRLVIAMNVRSHVIANAAISPVPQRENPGQRVHSTHCRTSQTLLG